MKNFIAFLVLFTLVGLSASVPAQEYAAQKAARIGYPEFDKLWTVIRPLLNRSWPAKDYATLITTAPDIQNVVAPLADIKYKTHNDFKYTAFKNALATLTQTAADYADAARNSDSAAVLQLFSQLHDQIETAASALLPIPWAEYEKLSAASDQLSAAIKESAGKKDVLEKKMLKISAAVDSFAAGPAPDKLKYRAKLIADEQGYFTKLATRLKGSLASGDMAMFGTLATELDVRLGTFSRMYLQ